MVSKYDSNPLSMYDVNIRLDQILGPVIICIFLFVAVLTNFVVRGQWSLYLATTNILTVLSFPVKELCVAMVILLFTCHLHYTTEIGTMFLSLPCR